MKKNGWSGVAAMLQSKESFPSISLILPAHRKSPGRTTDPGELKKALENVKEHLCQVCDKTTAHSLTESLYRLTADIDFVHNKDGIGLYVSPQVSTLVWFPFPVTSRLLIGDRFTLRDILYMTQFFPPYVMLTVSQKQTRLLKGDFEKLIEVNDEHFPFQFTDDYLYARPQLGTSFGYAMKGFEREKTLLKEKRQNTALKSFNALLPTYLENGTLLLLAGTERSLLHYAEMVDASLLPDTMFYGNFDHHSPEQLGQLALSAIQTAVQTENQQVFSRLRKAMDDKRAVTGIEAVWKEAVEGKGLHLLVEKDYAIQAYPGNDPAVLLFSKPGEDGKTPADVVEELTRLVINKNGRVSFVENGTLSAHAQIALILRCRE